MMTKGKLAKNVKTQKNIKEELKITLNLDF